MVSSLIAGANAENSQSITLCLKNCSTYFNKTATNTSRPKYSSSLDQYYADMGCGCTFLNQSWGNLNVYANETSAGDVLDVTGSYNLTIDGDLRIGYAKTCPTRTFGVGGITITPCSSSTQSAVLSISTDRMPLKVNGCVDFGPYADLHVPPSRVI